MIKLLDRDVGIELIGDPDKSPSGLLHIPEEAKERSDQGIVKYTGPNVEWVEVGDYVLFSGYSGTTVQLKDPNECIAIMHEKYIIAKLGGLPSGAFDTVTIPGLFFQENTQDGVGYFPATYEVAFTLLIDAVRQTDFAKSIALLDRQNKKIQAKQDMDYDTSR